MLSATLSSAMLSEFVLLSSEVRRACRRVVTVIHLQIDCGRWLSEPVLIPCENNWTVGSL
eukprot:9139607-Pyramimonas_sp.AAC.1